MRLWLFLTAAVAAVAAVFAGGCASTGQERGDAEFGPAPSFTDVAKVYNKRVAGLERLWARSTVRFQGVDEKEQAIDEQGEGHLQVIRPRKLYMTVGKVGNDAYELGSDDHRYWWIDVRERFALIGRHENARGRMLERAGLPVPPLDVMAVLGISELRPEAAAPTVTRSDDGRRLIVTMPRPEGTRELRLDPRTYEPLEILLRDKAGATTVSAELSEYAPVLHTEDAAGGGGVPSRMAMRIYLSAPKQRTEITLWLHDAENRGNKMRERAFDFDFLVREYRVQRVKDLDALPANKAN